MAGTFSSLSERDTKLIQYLARHNHFTPFTHCFVTLRESIPIFLARQRFKHMVGFSYNEVSRRYVDDSPKFYFPTWREKAENKKQGSAEEFKELDQFGFEQIANAAYLYALSAYQELLNAGVAPEQARMVLPQSMFTSYYVSGSLAAWARAYKLRTTGEYQKEWDLVTKQWDDIIRPLFPIAWAALLGEK